MTILCSCTEGKQALESPQLKQGLFTAALLEVMQESLAAGKEFRLSDETQDALAHRMTDIAKHVGLPWEQDPWIQRSDPMPVLLAGHQPQSTHLAPRKGQLRETIDLDIVECNRAANRGEVSDDYLKKVASSRRADWERAAALGWPEGLWFMGKCSEMGIGGVKRDSYEAVKWYRKAAELEDADAQFRLGGCYASGEGVEQDPQEAVKWYRKAAEQGYPAAQFILGVCYETGEGVEYDQVEFDQDEAVRWYRSAADQGFPRAQFYLGNCYRAGAGVEQDQHEAVTWYRKAAEQGDADAQYDLGICYAEGDGVEQDLPAALKWYLEAAEQGNAKCAASSRPVLRKWCLLRKWSRSETRSI